MSTGIRILAIAPYEEMKPLMMKLSEEYDNITLTVLVGDLNEGVAMAQNNYHDNYDVIISRGGTAKLIQKSVSLPVIEVNTSAYDILRTLKLSGAESNKVAIVGFSNITEQSLFLKEVLPYRIDVHTINSTDESLQILQDLMYHGYHAVLCDMVTYTTARTLGMDAFLITSGIESIHEAINEAIQYCNYHQLLRNENHFFRQLTKIRDIQTIVFTGEGKLFFTTISNDDFPLMETLHNELTTIEKEEKRHLVYRQNNMIYSIQVQRFLSDDSEFIAFYISTSKAPISGKKSGLHYFNKDQIEKEYFDSIYSTINFFSSYNTIIDQANQDLSPIIITGEEGTGKEQIAKAIYLRSSISHQPFIQIDCDQLNDKVWDYLLNHHNSPFCGADNTVFIKNTNHLNQERQRQLWIAITDMDIHKRNRLIISSVSHYEHKLDSYSMQFINQLNFFVITLPSLRDDLSRIEPILNLYLNRLNINSKKQILGFSSEAIDILSAYHWPYNFMQLSRVLNNLAIIAKSPTITAANVEATLKKELTIAPATSNNSRQLLNLSKSLSDINKEIAMIIWETNNGNNTKTANSLGISRTTLWRLLNSND